MREGIALTAFTERGRELAAALAAALGGSVWDRAQPLADWTAESFEACEALVFIGAAGIAVRSVAPYLRSKATDPAVICMDETGHWVIPILSGHLGGGNALARRLAALTGGEAVITTATDINGRFAVDLWAKRQGMAVLQPERIRHVSAKLLRGETITVDCPWPVAGSLPELVQPDGDAEVVVSYRRHEGGALQLAPRVLTLGVGCRRGTDSETLEAAFAAFCTERGIVPEAVERAATIELKRDEAGLLHFCASWGFPLSFYSAEELRAAPGAYTASAFVEYMTGVDNVCERAAVLASNGTLIEKKYARGGVTFALAERRRDYDWRWRDG
ncbi:MAG: cobalamin biosynthesis protein [Oscillospiraceae bacterium]|nr:cobalamin biosynthesis protein [Oscillospiraceae bacterium]